MSRRFRTLGLAVLLIGILFANAPLAGDIVTTGFVDSGIVTYDVDTEGPRQGGDYYASGNDDAFGEFGITTFNFTSADFGGQVLDIIDIALALTVHGRSFADGGTVEFFFSPDSGADLDSGGGDFSALVYDLSFGNGINNSQFITAPVSLGTFDVEATNDDRDGELDTFILSFEGTALADLIAAINNGTDFQIIIAAGTIGTDATYAGVDNNFGLGNPTLNITAAGAVPEPASAILLAVFGLAAMVRRRRS
jgi:hypothetical protein